MRIASIVFFSLVLVALTACGSGSGGSGPQPQPFVMPPFDAQRFTTPTANPYFPLVVGSKHTFRQDTPEGLEEIVIEVLPDVKVILGVSCVVVRDTVTLDGDLVEDTFDWFAPDSDGNVWYLGEDSKEYEDGVVVSTEGSWEAGVAGASAGIIMLAHPMVGWTYPQEDAPGVAEDGATVVHLSVPVTVPVGGYPSCLKTEEFTPLEPGAVQWKYYAPGVGLVLEEDPDGGRTELVAIQ
jgi:hypothetical protein